MSTAYTKIEKLEFIIQDELTVCNLFYTSTEPGTPWGGGWKTKTFPKTKKVIDILKEDIYSFILWSDGREGLEDKPADKNQQKFIANSEEVVGHTPFPRRSILSDNTPEELAIRNAMAAVEKMGADVRLTEAVTLLNQAFEKVADFVDKK
jgi:hypothetical protein